MSEDKALNVTVPEYQRDIYDKEAQRMGFATRSAYIRSMINAGRREFGLDSGGERGEDASLRGFIEERVIEVVSEADGIDREEVVSEIGEEVGEIVTESLERLDDKGVIDYDVQADGFVARGGR